MMNVDCYDITDCTQCTQAKELPLLKEYKLKNTQKEKKKKYI